ncbi:MAG TPA: signal peptidase I [Meiothermus sp.]|jgi:signal peptidase I|nr:signal peptidase I [Meiothermus sp.]
MQRPVTGTTPAVKPSFLRYLWHDWLRPVGEALLLAFLITTFAFTTVGVVGTSDLPNLHQGERLVVPKYQTWLHRFGIGSFKRGDLVVVKPPLSDPYAIQPLPVLGQWGVKFRPFFIKRIVALPGDRIRMEQGQLFVNGVAVDETHTVPYWRSLGQLDTISDRANSDAWPFRKGQIGEYVVPTGMYFVMGDNRSYGGSEDSRAFGPVPLDQIGGKANFVLWPPFKRDENGQWRLNWRVTGIPEGFRALEPKHP